MASSSSAIDDFEKDDVFLSFRGADTRYNFTSHLYDALCRNNIKVFIDYNIDRGDEITLALERAIEGAGITIIVFSPDYASSGSCLDELVKIMECIVSKAQLVLPIFYKVEPSEATYQEAFDKHKANFSCKKGRRDETLEEEMKVEKWKAALRKALGLAGWHIKKDSDEVKVIREIIEAISEKLKTSKSVGEKLICTSIIGKRAEDVFQQVREWLMSDNVSRVGIYGMGGVGKTTIATRINNEFCGAKAFAHVCWVTVSKDLNIWKLQNDIATAIKLNLFEKDDERKRAAELCNKLKTKRFLLILDDLWEGIQLEEAGIPPLISGQKVLLTSRNRGVCEGMECQSIEVKPLFEQDALNLFTKESKYKMNDSLEWKIIVHSIVKKCAGLPLAIIVVARRMIGVTEIRRWRNTLRELEKPCEGENQEVEKKVFRSLRFSYDGLSNNKVRRCFLYCSLFPEDYLFYRNRLITYLIGEGIVSDLESREAELDKGHCMIDELIHASLLQQDTSYDYDSVVKMHDVVRDMAHIVIKENSKAQDGLKAESILGEIESCVNLGSVWGYSSSECSNTIPVANRSRLTNLRLLSFDIEELLSDCSVDMKNLVILRSEYIISSRSISHLVNLRVLFLDFDNFSSEEDIPSLMAGLKNLKNLRHLELYSSDDKTIPKGIEKLIYLKVLKISFRGASDSLIILENLSQLQELQIGHDGVEARGLSSLKKLETLKIMFDENLESLNSYFQSRHWERLKEYHIFYGQRNLSYWIFKQFNKDGEYKKELYICNYHPDLEGEMVLPNNIEHLAVGHWNWNGQMCNFVRNNIGNNLRSLHIYCWSKAIQYLLKSAFVREVFLNLERLHIETFFGLLEIISVEGESEELELDEINNYTPIHLPKLKFFKLNSWKGNVRSIYKGRIWCPSLERIEIVYCWGLKRLPFYMKEDDQEAMQRKKDNYSKIQLEVKRMPKGWWDSLHWDHPNLKSIYQFHEEDPIEYEPLDLTLKL